VDGSRRSSKVARTLALMLICSSLAGCELVTNFDRGKIPIARPDAGKKAAVHKDAGTGDAAVGDAAAGQDAG
jgi:hypothetical protein